MTRPYITVSACCLSLCFSIASAYPAIAQQERTQEKKFLASRTPISNLDRTNPSQSVLGFADAMTRSNYFSAYFYLSFEAKRGFVTSLMTGDFVHLFVGYDVSNPPSAISLGTKDQKDVLLDLQLDGARVFDDVMFAAEKDSLLPFTFGQGLNVASATAGGEGQATVELVTGAEPSLLTFHLQMLSNGEWRIDLIGSKTPRQGDRPWRVSP